MYVSGVGFNLGRPAAHRSDIGDLGLDPSSGFDAWVPIAETCDFQVYAVTPQGATLLPRSVVGGQPIQPQGRPHVLPGPPVLTGPQLWC